MSDEKKQEIKVAETASMKVYDRCTNAIRNAQGKADGLAKTIAKNLTEMAETKSYQLAGYKNIYEYASTEHYISRGTTSDAINVWKRFSDGKAILEQYASYSWSVLIRLKNFTDEQIAEIGVNPEMTRTEVIAKIEQYTNKALPQEDNEEVEETEEKNVTVEKNADNEEDRQSEEGTKPRLTMDVKEYNSVDELLTKLGEYLTDSKYSEFYEIVITR